MNKQDVTAINKQNINTEGGNQEDTIHDAIHLAQIAASYKFYIAKQTAGFIGDDFLLSTTAKDTWKHPLLHLYNICQSNIMDFDTTYTFDILYKNKNIPAALKRNIKKNIDRLQKQQQKYEQDKLVFTLALIYYAMVFDKEFKHEVDALFDPLYLSDDILELKGDKGDKGARVANTIFEFCGRHCIECTGNLNKSYRSTRDDCKGTIGIAYHRHKRPILAVSYLKRCESCDISYSYNRIDYGAKIKGKKDCTLWFDPRHIPFFATSKKPSSLIHVSIMDSIYQHQFCSKPTSIEMWVEHYNEEWQAIYNNIDYIIKNNTTNTISAELGYRTVLRYFYFYFLLCSIADMKTEENVINTIKVNDRTFKIAVIMTESDKNELKKINKLEESDDISNHYFKYIFNKHYFRLSHSSIPELAEIPVKLNNSGDIEIYPGAFVVYGDGGQKINRSRCAYPAVLAQYDMVMQYYANHNNNNNINNNNINQDEHKLNDIGVDDNIDYANKYNATMYSAARYYECDHSPQQAVKANDGTRSNSRHKTCIQHTYQLQAVHNILPEDCQLFVSWYQLHSTISKLNQTDVSTSISKYYDYDESKINSIASKQANKLSLLQTKLHQLITKHGNKEKIDKFTEHIDEICKIITKYKQHKAESAEPPRKRQRQAAQRARANINEQSIMIREQEYIAAVQEIINDDDELQVEHYNMTMDVRDLLDLEIKNNKLLEQYGGCRKAHNINIATACKTNGLNVLMTCSGFIIRLREEIIRETPTGIIIDIADACTYNSDMIQYTNRIEALGYDMMCRLYYRIDALAKDNRLSDIQYTFWISMLKRLFVDIWHISTHTDSLCALNEAAGVFHPKLAKFEQILHSISEDMERVNDIIAEQFWSTMNASAHLKSMTRERFLFFLILKTKQYNERHKIKLEKQGWTFIPISHFTTLRDIANPEGNHLNLPSLQELQQQNQESLARVNVKPEKIEDIKQMLTIKAVANNQ